MVMAADHELRQVLAKRKGDAPNGKAVELAGDTSFKSIAMGNKAALAEALPRTFPGGADRFLRVLTVLVNQTPELARCEPISVLGAGFQAAMLGLTPGINGECYFIPRGGKATFMVGSAGWRALAQRSGVRTISGVARQGDRFVLHRGVDEQGRYRIAFEHEELADTDAPVMCYYALLIDDRTGRIIDGVKRDRTWVEKRRQASDSRNSPAWSKWYDEMALAKVLKDACKRVPVRSVELDQALHVDEGVRTSIDRDDPVEAFAPAYNDYEDDEPAPALLVAAPVEPDEVVVEAEEVTVEPEPAPVPEPDPEPVPAVDGRDWANADYTAFAATDWAAMMEWAGADGRAKSRLVREVNGAAGEAGEPIVTNINEITAIGPTTAGVLFEGLLKLGGVQV